MSVSNTSCNTGSNRISSLLASVSQWDPQPEPPVSAAPARSYAETIEDAETLQGQINTVLNSMPFLPEEQEERTKEQESLSCVRQKLENCLDNSFQAFGGENPEHPKQHLLEMRETFTADGTRYCMEGLNQTEHYLQNQRKAGERMREKRRRKMEETTALPWTLRSEGKNQGSREMDSGMGSGTNHEGLSEDREGLYGMGI